MKTQNIFRKLFFIAGCAAIACIVNVNDSHAASATAAANGKVIVPIQILKTGDLNFGSFLAGAGTVVVDNAGARTKTGAVALASSGTAPSAAAFDISGEPSATYSISVPATLDLMNGANKMVATLTNNIGTTGTLSAGGTQTLNIGGSLAVADGQASGAYTASLIVSVDYN
ncbi:DUF4402 domain-containing protein [Geomonas sp. RF6]|uniref:DUF4402 domain-containing protein n=1 Tax=Geomonas sp. RF6 TaxID=2897342 RepID=UPI001E41873F|nr:DUF4402 domain-containing protein [Geomonas sp. RF6]UFS71141.1 DUF4402 domain-containing protein [Geomonas sp. RF6]